MSESTPLHDVVPEPPAPPDAVWSWDGELDASDVERLTAQWQRLLADRPRQVVLDLGAVTFLDCAVLSVLVRANATPHLRLVLADVPECVTRLLQITDLTQDFTTGTRRGVE